MTEAPAYVVVGAAVLFALAWIASAFWPRAAREGRKRARAAHSLAVSAGSDESVPPADRAAALVRAGRIALGELKSVRLAARHAEWAHRLAPASDEVVALLADTFPRARRLRALERLLWKSADAQGDSGAGQGALDALVTLYEGPLARPERARTLRRLRAPSG
jgi:hypothetical protein